MAHVIHLQPGENLLPARFENVRVETFGSGPLVRLVGEARPHVRMSPDPGVHPQATTLEIHMDPKAAIELAARISDLARSMGWPLPPGVLSRA